MSTFLALDIGSSSVIAGILRGRKTVFEAPRVFFKTNYQSGRVEVDADEMLGAVRRAIAGLDGRAKKVDAIALAVMSPGLGGDGQTRARAHAAGDPPGPAEHGDRH